jgi:hypothetical protein
MRLGSIITSTRLRGASAFYLYLRDGSFYASTFKIEFRGTKHFQYVVADNYDDAWKYMYGTYLVSIMAVTHMHEQHNDNGRKGPGA